MSELTFNLLLLSEFVTKLSELSVNLLLLSELIILDIVKAFIFGNLIRFLISVIPVRRNLFTGQVTNQNFSLEICKNAQSFHVEGSVTLILQQCGSERLNVSLIQVDIGKNFT